MSRLSDPEARSLVRNGWNQVSFLYRPDAKEEHDATGHSLDEYRAWLDPIIRGCPAGAAVLDLGCGCGVPTSRSLADRFRVLGIDVSDVQIQRARELVPRAKFRRADMTALRFLPGSFSAIVALYSIIHVPLPQQRPLVRRIYRWLAPGGYFLAVVGAGRYRGVEKGWLGSPGTMFWDHTDADTYQRWLKEAGFLVEERRTIPEGDAGHELFRARRGG